MRVLALSLVVLAFAAGSAVAEKVKANQPAKLLNHPGEQGKVLYKIKEGQNMTLLGQEGRWLKVRVGGRTGYVPRSKVEMSDNEELARNTRHRPFVGGRSTNRGFSSQEGPDDRVGADALGETSSSGSGDKSSDDEETPKAKGKGKAKASSSDDEEETPKAKGKGKAKASSSDDEEETPKAKGKGKAKASSSDDEEETPKAKGKGKGKGGDDEEVDEDSGKEGGNEGKGGDEPTETDERPRAHVGSKMKVFSERDKDSEVSFVAKPSDVLYPTDSKGKWTMVETDEGDAGWVLTDSLDQDGGGGGKAAKRVIDLNARLGVTFIQQGMRTQGTTKTMGMDQVPDVYNIGTSAGTLSFGGMVLMPVKVKYLLGGELTFDGSKTLLGGVNYMSTTTALSIADINLRGVFAYPTARKSGLTILAKLGFRYRGYQVADYQDPAKNPARIPQETLKAPTLGAAIVLPMLTDKVGLQVGLDAILFGASIDQTAGLEDGATPSMSSVHLNVGFIYRFSKSYNLCGAYDLDYASYDFGAPNTGAAMQSTRGHTGTDVSRTDILHTVSFGIQKGF